MKRRDFVKTMAMSGVAVAASDMIGELIAQTPQGRVMQSKFKGLSDVALTEAKQLGCTYSDIRFTRSTNMGVNASGGNRDSERLRRRWRRSWWRRGWRRRRWSAAVVALAAEAGTRHRGTPALASA